MTTKKAAAKQHFAKTEAANAGAEPVQSQAQQQPAAQPQQILCFVFTPQETDTVFNALGELPAKLSEGLRGKIKAQSEQQAALLKGLFSEPSVQAVISA